MKYVLHMCDRVCGAQKRTFGEIRRDHLAPPSRELLSPRARFVAATAKDRDRALNDEEDAEGADLGLQLHLGSACSLSLERRIALISGRTRVHLKASVQCLGECPSQNLGESSLPYKQGGSY